MSRHETSPPPPPKPIPHTQTPGGSNKQIHPLPTQDRTYPLGRANTRAFSARRPHKPRKSRGIYLAGHRSAAPTKTTRSLRRYTQCFGSSPRHCARSAPTQVRVHTRPRTVVDYPLSQRQKAKAGRQQADPSYSRQAFANRPPADIPCLSLRLETDRAPVSARTPEDKPHTPREAADPS